MSEKLQSKLDQLAELASTAKNDTARRMIHEVVADLRADIDELESLKEDIQQSRANGEGLLSAKQVLAKVFPDEASRPSDRWLRRLAAKGEVPSVRLGGNGAVFFKLSEVVDALDKGEDFEAMSQDELWTRYRAIFEEKGASAASRFYKAHIGGRS